VTPGGAILDAGSIGADTVVAKLITAGVDLIAALLSQPPAAVEGGTNATASVQSAENGTNRAAGIVMIELEVATDTQGDGATTLKSIAEKIDLKHQQRRAYRIAFIYPDGLMKGNYYLLAVVNNGTAASLQDLNLVNNVALSSHSVVIAPEQISLGGSDLSAASAFVPGKISRLILTLTNSGNVIARGNTTIQFFLSTDQSIGGGTLTAKSTLSASLPPGKSRLYHLSLVPSASLVPGTYYLIAVVDPVDSLGTIDRSDSAVVDATQLVIPAS
jgi:hypothetical protein